ncbi:uncharacterized protein PV07_02534 [Cladophialophora immunda]|uniref:RRM domain-containing protein n=1 Tax=Cladophialophora immunda TaxID=569365 RepID=A0A0D1ZS00_9EURO|nr:uncharacterized protein PV07_02534 [Cladophialophora immunda]KIW30841.1 hypothetical protein PV07_02534 [Cladophialophora immunda]OQV02152.1 hypothetical protein CLAIMM_07392 [Cladophialophora immunda]
MAASSLYDDPAHIARFLEVLRGTSKSAETETQFNDPWSKLNPQSPDFSPKITVANRHVENGLPKTSNDPQGVQLSHQRGPDASPLAPFQSPFPQVTSTQKSARVDLVQDQNGLVTEPTNPDAEQVLFEEHPNIPNKRPLTPTQHRLLVGKKPGIEHLTEDKLAELSKQTQGYMNNVVDRFRKSKEQNLAHNFIASDHVPSVNLQAENSSHACSSLATDGDQESNPCTPDAASIHYAERTSVNRRASASQNDGPNKSSDQHEAWQEKSPDSVSCHTPVVDYVCKNEQQYGNDYSEQVRDSTGVVPFPSFNEGPPMHALGNVKEDEEERQEPTAAAAVKDKPLSTSTPNLHGHSTVAENSGEESVPVIHKASDSVTPLPHTQSPTIVVTASTDTDDSVEEDNDDDDEQEDRENLVRFKSWGAPAARNKSKSRPRTVILTGLPRGTDFTLVQSLIHGGAIEGMRLIDSNPERITISAHVTFTSADACDRYYAEYPKGLEIRYQGRKWFVLVHKKEQVDVVSGMLQGYLDCGATRVVKVSGADDDWGIVALNKLAEGKTGTRQVEAVQDTYRNGIRTIVFRFANISHAVQFKSHLIRSDDWYGCHVEFAEDPCEKASAIRND